MAEALGGMVVTLMATVGGIVMRSAQEIAPAEASTTISLDLMAGLITSLPGLITLAGIVGATLIAGPLGFFGALMEVAGTNQLLYNQNVGGIYLVFLGAGVVTLGALVPWGKILISLLESDSRY
ncbi:hypothetical protein EXE43_07555 [Halorubrum sp. SS5]|nr:hypothetical protein EXE43_07555 [Halorubrum sp. SS5]